MKKETENRMSREELAALLKRAEARALQKGDYEIITAITKKTLTLWQLYREGKDPSDDELGELLAIPRPEKADE
jgi:transposase